MRRSLIAFLLALSSAASAQTVTGPQCSLEWNPVVDPRLTGYRVYVDGAMTVDQFKWTLIKCETALIPKGKEVKVYVTAVGATPNLESLPSNTLTMTWTDVPVVQRLGAPAQVRLRVEVTQ